MKALIFTLASLGIFTSAALAQADQWQGSGAVYSPQGDQLSTYSVKTDLSRDGQKFESHTVITGEDGTTKEIDMQVFLDGNKFQTKSNLGDGGGACYGEGICESYIDAGNGKAFATTVIQDGENAQRSITYELQNGKAVRVMREKVARVK